MQTAPLDFRLATRADEELLIALMREFYAEDRIDFDDARVRRGVDALLADPRNGEVLLWLDEVPEEQQSMSVMLESLAAERLSRYDLDDVAHGGTRVPNFLFNVLDYILWSAQRHPESAAVGMWDAEEGCLKRLCRLRDRKVLDAAGFLLHESDDPDELLTADQPLSAQTQETDVPDALQEPEDTDESAEGDAADPETSKPD